MDLLVANRLRSRSVLGTPLLSVVHIKSPHRRATGNYLKFENNGVVLWKRKEESPVGTRIRFSVPIELRFMGYLKVVLLAAGTF